MAEVFAPFNNAEVVTPSDTVNPNQPYTGLLVTVAGTVTILTKGNQVVALGAQAIGFTYKGGVKRVNATGTAATVVGFW